MGPRGTDRLAALLGAGDGPLRVLAARAALRALVAAVFFALLTVVVNDADDLWPTLPIVAAAVFALSLAGELALRRLRVT